MSGKDFGETVGDINEQSTDHIHRGWDGETQPQDTGCVYQHGRLW